MFECFNFGDSLERPGSDPLFATEKKCGVVNQVNKDKVKALQENSRSLDYCLVSPWKRFTPQVG